MSEFYLENDADTGLAKGALWLNWLAEIQRLRRLLVEANKP